MAPKPTFFVRVRLNPRERSSKNEKTPIHVAFSANDVLLTIFFFLSLLRISFSLFRLVGQCNSCGQLEGTISSPLALLLLAVSAVAAVGTELD